MSKQKRYPDCHDERSLCAQCSLSSYNRDCRNNPINTIAYLRHTLGLTQNELATQAGISIKQVQKLEYGEIAYSNMTAKNAHAIALALNTTVGDLLADMDG